MLELTESHGVSRVRMWTWRTAVAGYDVSAYVVRGVVIDTGFRHVGAQFARALERLRPRGIVVTHWHEDHAGNAPVLAERWPMWMTGHTERKLRERQQVKLYRHFTWGRPRALTVPVRPFDMAPLQAIPTPGHSPDHHVVWDPESRNLFSGDLWLGIRVKVMGASENPYQIITSLDRAIALEPRRMYDAHRGPIDEPDAALRAKRAWLQDTVGAIEQRLDAGDSEQSILRGVLGGEERMALVTEGEYSRRNLVRAVARHRASAMHR